MTQSSTRPPTPSTPAAPAAAPPAPGGPGSAALSAHVAGPVLAPGDPGYAEEVAGFNVAHGHRPDLVVGARCAEDVAVAVRHAAEHGLRLSVQATGHGTNAAVPDGLMVSTRRLDAVSVDPESRTARVGAGVRWREVIDAAAPHGLAPLSGSSSDVGVVGYTLGGGVPVMGRRFGFSADHVRALEVVTPDGRLREVDAEREPELFWGLRGGKGNLGLVTAITVDLLPVAEVYGGGLFFAGEHLPAVLAAYREWSAGLPEECCTSLAVLRLPPLPEIPEPLRGGPVAHLRVCHTGDAEEGERLVAPMRSAAPVLLDALDTMPYTAVDGIHRDPDHPVPFHERSVLLHTLDQGTVDALVEVAGPGADCPLLMVELRHLGGALARPPEVANAVSGRDAAYSVMSLAVPPPPGAAPGAPPPDAPFWGAAAESAVAAVAPWSTGHTLLNMHGTPGDEADRARAWDPEAYRRLSDLRRRYDPAGLLASGHVINTRD